MNIEWTLSAQALKDILVHNFPPDATSWADATDELKDMLKNIWERLGLTTAHDWSVYKTPAEWNEMIISMILGYYQQLDEDDQEGFSLRFGPWFKEWAWKWVCAKHGR